MNRRIVRNGAMREETARQLQASLSRRRPTRHTQIEVKNTRQIPANKPTPGADVLFTGGIGDFIAIESFLTSQEKDMVRRVYLATRAAGAIQTILKTIPIFPSLDSVISLHDDWSKVFCVFTLDDLIRTSDAHRWGVHAGNLPKGIVDYSISQVFPQIIAGHRKFSRCRMLDHKIAEVGKFRLPKDYAFIQPYSPNDRQNGHRDYTVQEWSATIEFLRGKNLKGVVVLNSDDYVPEDPAIIDLSNETTIAEALEIARRCHAYIGVDSCFAAFVTKFLGEDRLFIKSVNDHYLGNVAIYAAPHVRSDFVCPDLSKKLKL